MSEPTRPALRWHGGKWKLAPWIMSHFPPHRLYVEPFGGAASILLRKPRSYAEVYNDLDESVVKLFRVLRGPRASELIDALSLTPFARTEFELSYEPAEDDVEEARRLVVRSFMGFGSDGHNRAVKTGFRANSSRSGSTPAQDWANYPDALRMIVDRLRRVVIECRDASEVMTQHDGPETLHYVDPPYLPETRSKKSRRGKIRYHAYAHEMDDADHESLLGFLDSLTGMVVLSGYPSPTYEARLGKWHRLEKPALADGGARAYRSPLDQRGRRRAPSIRRAVTESRCTMNAPVPKGAQAVMASRRDVVDSLDFFPTPPWATRALIYDVLIARSLTVGWMSAWDPAAGEGHMAHVLEEYFKRVSMSDVYDYGRGFEVGSFVGEGADVIPDKHVDWIITNPPFNLAVDFAERALRCAQSGTALLVRAVWAEGGDRYRRLFKDRPPTYIAQFCDRVPMTKGRWDPQASTATAYAWFIWWDNSGPPETHFIWIPPGAKARHHRADDVERFAGAPA